MRTAARVSISEEAANLAFDLAVQLMDRTRDIGVCMFCDSFENTRGPREHGPVCPVGKFEAFVSPMLDDDIDQSTNEETVQPSDPTEGTKGEVILTAIRAVDGDIYYRDLAARLGFDPGHVAAFLSTLRKQGHVERVGAGQWRARR
jgi:hypothetical protein